MKLPTFRASPLAVGAAIDYGVDWTDVLAELGDAHDSTDWTVPAGLTVTGTGGAGNVRTVWLSGLTPGAYRVVAWLNTVGGRRVSVILLIDVLDV